MKFTVSSKTLLNHLSAASKVISPKNMIRILDNFLFTLKDNELVAVASDKENTIWAKIELVSSEGSGSFAVDAKRLLELLKALPDQGLNFDINESTYEIHIQYDNGDYRFVGMNGSDFPLPEELAEEHEELVIPAQEISKSIEKTIFAVSTTDTQRPVMMGILCDIKPEEVVFVATDTHKLVRYINSRIAPGIAGSFILPTKPASIMSQIFTKDEGDIKISFDAKSAIFEGSNYTMRCTFINGKYPNYNAAIPQTNQYEVVVDKAMILNAVRRVAVFATEGGLVQLEFSDSKIEIRTQDLEYSSSAKESLTCNYSGQPMSVGFHKDKIIEVLNNISGENLTLRLSGVGRPGLFLPVEQEEKEDWLALLMPMIVPNM